MPDYPTILSETNNGVAVITLNRPERLNAVTDQLLADVTHALKQAGRDKAIRAILLTGAGRGFCAGQDLDEFSGVGSHQVYDHLMQHYRPLIKLLRTTEKPIIAAINGPAAGAGASLALACDLKIMAASAYLLEAFNNIGAGARCRLNLVFGQAGWL